MKFSDKWLRWPIDRFLKEHTLNSRVRNLAHSDGSSMEVTGGMERRQTTRDAGLEDARGRKRMKKIKKCREGIPARGHSSSVGGFFLFFFHLFFTLFSRQKRLGVGSQYRRLQTLTIIIVMMSMHACIISCSVHASTLSSCSHDNTAAINHFCYIHKESQSKPEYRRVSDILWFVNWPDMPIHPI